jgi:dipeptidyl aminopeptidase/acylaminoacyl peptidase
MNENRLRSLLRDEPVPGAAEAERRSRAVVERAYAERQPLDRPVLPRLALALAAVTLLAGLILSPAGAAVRDWIDDAFTAGVPNAEPALSDLPGGGRLLVQSAAGPWVVQPDGSRRLLGRYGGAIWSPHGLFVAATAGRTLSALEPDGTPRWSLSAAAPASDPRWSPSGYRVAYRAGRDLRVVNADGSQDRLMDRGVAPVAAAWFPLGTHLLAYLDRSERLHMVDADTASTIASVGASPGTVGLAWAPDGSLLLERSLHGLWLRQVTSSKLAGRLAIGGAQPIQLPASATIHSAAFSPEDQMIAALLQLPALTAGEPRSEVVLIDSDDGSRRRLFAVSGELSDLAWSPDGSRLLLAWPAADQWLFLPLQGNERIRAVEGIVAIFSPGNAGRAPFPRIDGWCCSAR